MSRLYEALRRLEGDRESGKIAPDLARPEEIFSKVMDEKSDIDQAPAAEIKTSPHSRLVALSAPTSLGAEKFRALATRLDSIRQQRDFKSFQVTSSVGSEGKSFVAANLAITLARHKQSKVLLLEGDLRRPSLVSLFGMKEVKGMIGWWSQTEGDLTQFLCHFRDMPLWFLGAGKAQEQPADILQSARFSVAFTALAAKFDWVVVDSTPMLPVVDANLWSRLVDGTLLVVREDVAPVSALKKGLEGLDNPKLIGIVLNEASEFQQANYKNSYYASR